LLMPDMLVSLNCDVALFHSFNMLWYRACGQIVGVKPSKGFMGYHP